MISNNHQTYLAATYLYWNVHTTHLHKWTGNRWIQARIDNYTEHGYHSNRKIKFQYFPELF